MSSTTPTTKTEAYKELKEAGDLDTLLQAQKQALRQQLREVKRR